MEQTVFLTSQKRSEENIKLCDIYIEPDITGYSSTSFTAGEALIDRGERAAREQFDRLKALAESEVPAELNHILKVGRSPFAALPYFLFFANNNL